MADLFGDPFEEAMRGADAPVKEEEFDAPEPARGATFLEYPAHGGEVMRCEDFEGYKIYFGIAEEQFPEFQGAIVLGNHEVWGLICRVFGICPVLTPKPVEAEGIAGVAKGLGAQQQDIDARLGMAKSIWNRRKLKEASGGKSDPTGGDIEALTEREVDELLNGAGLDYVDADRREFAAGRVQELEPYLSGAGNELLVQLVMMDVEILDLREDIKESRRLGKARKGYSDDRKELAELQKARMLLMDKSGILGAMREAGAVKRSMGACLSDVTLTFRDYYESEENQIFDGMFAQGEAELLLEKVTQRDYAYRPDVVLHAYQASIALFDPDYKQKKTLSQRMAHGLLMCWKDVADAVNKKLNVPEKDLEIDLNLNAVALDLDEAQLGPGADEATGVSSVEDGRGGLKPWEVPEEMMMGGGAELPP